PYEQWSFVGSKARQRRFWYAYHTGVLACKTLCFSRSGELHEKVICIYFLKYC
ncbi:TPA: IS1 family transposase, partial [Escherichia coli]